MAKQNDGSGRIKRIFGFLIKHKWLTLIGVVVLFILFAKLLGSNKVEDERVVSLDTASASDVEAQEQAYYVSLWGEAGTGFKWDSKGNKVAIGDSDKTAEDVAYAYLRALTQLEFVTSAKYNNTGIVANSYNSMYDTQTTTSTSQFIRNLYKQCLLSIEIDGVDSVAMFEDGRYIITFSLSIIDLTNKDFWLADSEEIYSNMFTYSSNEGDTSKANQYLYGYLLDYYSSDSVLKRSVTVDLVLDKVNGSWLVSNDSDVDSLCRYTNGAVVSDYIWTCYNAWLNTN